MAFGAILGQTASGGGGGGKRVCRFTVGTSTAGWTANDCDYLCDGTDDQVEINAAIQALPTGGGEVIILDGTYNITATIAMNKNNVTLSGNGSSTVLKRMWNSSDSYDGVVSVKRINGGCVKNLQIDGNGVKYTSLRNSGIFLIGSDNIIITDNTCNNNNRIGISLFNNNKNNIIANNLCNNNKIGIDLNELNNNNVFTGNTCNNNDDYGIYLDSNNNNVFIGNTCNNNKHGIDSYNSSNNVFTGNTCNNNDYGMYLYGFNNNNTITGNTFVRGSGQTSDYNSIQYTIRVNSSEVSNNLIVGNNIMGKNYVDSGTNNTWANNKYN